MLFSSRFTTYNKQQNYLVSVPALEDLPLSTCGCKKFVIDTLGDHVITCTVHSGAKKAHDWEVDKLSDLFRTTHKVKPQQVVRSRGQQCGDITLTLVLMDTYINYPNDIDRSLNEAAVDKIRKYRADYNNNPPFCISFIPVIGSTSGRLHSEFVGLLD
jgi:hypothetical protein